jgi:hypothetical protein
VAETAEEKAAREAKEAADKAEKDGADKAAADRAAKETADKEAKEKEAKEKKDAMSTVVQDVARLKKHTKLDEPSDGKETRKDDDHGSLWCARLFG